MKQNRMTCLVAILYILNLFQVEIVPAETVRYLDPTGYASVRYISFKDGRTATLKEGDTLTVSESVEVVTRTEGGWQHTPVEPKPFLKISIRKLDAVRKESMLGAMMLVQRRKAMFNYPPVSSAWHLPVGIAQLSSILRSEGHEVVQRYGHILGLEYVLKQYGGQPVEEALRIIRDPASGVLDWYRARKTFEGISRGIKTQDKFEVARNNASYVSIYYDGTIEQALEAVKNREQHLWWKYFTEVEVPLALGFKPDIYGISIADERQFVQSLVLASLIKDALPKCLVVLGGNFWSRVTGVFQIPEFAKFFDFCDAIVYREGFQPIVELAETLNPRLASGTVWRDGDRVVVNPPTTKPTSFETLSTPYFDGGALQWAPDFVPSLYTTSNCPMTCGFCAIAAGSDSFLAKPRAMSPQRIAEHMVRLGVTRYEIFDETFPVGRQLALGKELKRIGLSATWDCYLTVTDNLAKPEICEQLYAAGCRNVQLGLESLSPETLARENKKWNTPENYGRILQNLYEAGIQTHVFLLVGLPGEPLHQALRWLPFLEDYGDYILTIKSGRYRVTRMSPEELEGKHGEFIEVSPDTKPLHLNRDFQYSGLSNKRVDAMRTVLEEECRRHWAYGITSTIPWWVNRGRYTQNELRAMAQYLPSEESVPHLGRAIAKMNGIIRDELGREVNLQTFAEVQEFARTLL